MLTHLGDLTKDKAKQIKAMGNSKIMMPMSIHSRQPQRARLSEGGGGWILNEMQQGSILMSRMSPSSPPNPT